MVSDVDGTLVTEDKFLTTRAQAAVTELRASGIPFSITSARPPRGLRMLIEPLGITTLLIGFNGGVVTTTDFSILTERLQSPEIARHAVGLLDANQVQVWVFSGQDWFVRDSGGPYVRKEEHTVAFGPTVVENFGSTLDAAAKIVGVSRDFGLLARCESDVRTALADSAFVARSHPYYLDVTHPLANKGTALTDVAKLLGVPLAEIAVIGDGGNDIAMFERSGLSIAMGNASPEVQHAADLVTDSNEEEGFANAIERFILGLNRIDAAVFRDPYRRPPSNGTFHSWMGPFRGWSKSKSTFHRATSWVRHYPTREKWATDGAGPRGRQSRKSRNNDVTEIRIQRDGRPATSEPFQPCHASDVNCVQLEPSLSQDQISEYPRRSDSNTNFLPVRRKIRPVINHASCGDQTGCEVLEVVCCFEPNSPDTVGQVACS